MKLIIGTSKVDHLILLAGFFITVLLVLLGINRGFDISDEGFYVLIADPNQENIYGLTYYDLFFKLLYQVFQIKFSVIELRLIRLISVILGAWFIASWAKKRNPQFSDLEWYLISALGLFISYSFLPQTLSYNSLALFFVSAWLYSLDEKYKLLKSLKFGLLLALLLYVKATVALGLGLVTVGLILFENKISWNAWKHLAGLIIPFLALEVLFQIFLKESFLTRIDQLWNAPISRRDYDLGLLLKINLAGWFWTFILLVNWFLVGKLSKPLFWINALIVSLIVAWYTHITAEWNHIFLICLIALIGFTFGKGKKKVCINSILLFILPFILHLGSKTYFFRIAIIFCGFWVIWVFVFSLNPNNSSKSFSFLKLTIFTILIVLQGIWIDPFGIKRPLWFSDNLYSIPSNSNLLIDEELVSMLKNVGRYVENKESFLAAYEIPGIPFLLGQTIPKTPGYWGKESLMFFWRSENQPLLLMYQPINSLPKSWSYSDTLGSWTIRNKTQYLLSK